MKFLIDAMVMSEPTKRRPDPRVAGWFSAHRHECAISILTLGEVEKGIVAMDEGKRKEGLLLWFEQMEKGMASAGRILPIDRELIRVWGEVYNREERLTRRKPPFVDTLLAATAEMHGLTMVTRNVKDFPSSLRVINPWDDAAAT